MSWPKPQSTLWLHCVWWNKLTFTLYSITHVLPKRQLTPTALNPTFRDSPFAEFLWSRSRDTAIGFTVVISSGKSVLPLDTNLTSPKLPVARIATRKKTTSCQENKKINYKWACQHGEKYKGQGHFIRLLVIWNEESVCSWNYVWEDRLELASSVTGNYVLSAVTHCRRTS
jgi:hypothetical protein